MKILVISSLYYPDIGGGAEYSTKILCEGLKKKYDIKVLSSSINEKIEIIDGVEIIRKKFGNRSSYVQIYNKNSKNKTFRIKERLKRLYIRFKDQLFPSLYKEYYNFFKNLDIDIVHTSNNMTFLNLTSCWKAARNQNISVIHTLRDPALLSYNFELEKLNLLEKILNFFWRMFSKINIRNVDVIHSPSEYMIDLHKRYKFRLNKESIIPNTVDCKVIKPNFLNKENIIIYVGILEPKKGVLTLIEAFKKINNSTYKLLLIGNGSLEKKISREYKELNIEITGWLNKEDVYKKIEKSKVLILPSEWDEAFGRVLVEGIYNGTLVIGSNRGGIPEVLNHEEKYIFEAGNIESLKNKQMQILNYDEKEYKFELEKMQKIMKKYSIENHIKRFIDLYESIIKNKN